MRISDWSSDVCSSDLALGGFFGAFAARETNAFAQERWWRLSRGYPGTAELLRALLARGALRLDDLPTGRVSAVLNRGEIVIDSDLDGRWAPVLLPAGERSEEHTSELQSLMRTSYAVFCLKKK